MPVVPEPGEGEPDWKPLRHFLGIESFGANVFVARAPGDRIVVEHTELGERSAGHQEVYVVLAGEVEFTLDGDRVEAAAGTVVAITDPAVRRAGVATAAGATVLALGGVPGRPYSVSEWDARWTGGLPHA